MLVIFPAQVSSFCSHPCQDWKAGSTPSRENAIAWVNAYGEAWRLQDPDLIVALYTEVTTSNTQLLCILLSMFDFLTGLF